MAVTNSQTQPAADQGVPADDGVSRSQKMLIGANVALAVGLAAAMLVAVNWFASLKHIRKDASTFGGYGLSERTRTILGGLSGDVTVTTAYLSTEPGKSKDKYFGPLASYCDDLHLANAKVQTQHVARDEDKNKLVERLKKQYGGESGEHEKVITDFKKLKGELGQSLQFGANLQIGGGENDPWLAYFPFFVDMVRGFEDDKKQLEQIDEEVAKLIGPGLPKYADATNKISGALRPLKDSLTRHQKSLGAIAGLAESIRKPDSTLIKTLREVAAEVPGLVKSVSDAVGGAGGEAPADAKAALSAFAAAAQDADAKIKATARKIEELARENPGISSHPYWQLGMAMQGLPGSIGIDATQLLASAANNLRQNRQQILDIVDRNDPTLIGNAIKQIRTRLLPQLDTNFKAIQTTFGKLADALGKIDKDSAALLDAAKGGAVFAAAIKSIEALTGRIDKLPELKLGKIGDELKGDNIVVVEASGQAKVVNFDSVWPLRETISAGGFNEGEDRPRTFNGDSAVGGAVLALTSEKPFATVVFTSFEVEPPQQMRQFMQPQDSSIPMKSLNQLKERLKAANFAVKDWDLSKAAPAPEPEKGTENIYIFLPPAPGNPPNPFQQNQPPSREFGDAERKRVQEVLGIGASTLGKPARGLFLAGWEVRRAGFFGGFNTPEYGYGKLLKEEYGIQADTAHRVVQVEPDPRTPERFGVTGEKFQYMVLNNFATQPIVEPFKNSRIIVMNVCPVVRADKTPDGVTLEPLVNIPPSEDYILADPAEVIRIVNAIQDPDAGGKVERKPSPRDPPYPVAMAATKKKGDKEMRVVVFGTGQSLIDEYLTRPVVRMGPKGLYADPPPTGNVDLVTNSLHWLRGQDKWIAAGPVAVPVIQAIQPPQKMWMLRLVLCLGLPVLVCAGGIVMWMARRQ